MDDRLREENESLRRQLDELQRQLTQLQSRYEEEITRLRSFLHTAPSEPVQDETAQRFKLLEFR